MKTFLLCTIFSGQLFSQPFIATLVEPFRQENSSSPRVAAVRQKWLQWANDYVEGERREYLRVHRVVAPVLWDSESEVVQRARSEIDQRVNEGAEKYVKQQLSTETRALTARLDAAAREIFKKNIRIILDSEIDSLGVAYHYGTQTVYMHLNVAAWDINDLSQFKAVLRHEYAHVVYQDVLVFKVLKDVGSANIIKYINREEITIEECRRDLSASLDALSSLSRAHEIRADVYAAITAPDHGKQLLVSLKKIEGMRHRILSPLSA